MKSNDKIEKEIRNSNKEFIENDLRPFLRIPSNTLNREGILKAKDFIISYISDFCKEIKVIQSTFNPLILAKVEGKIEKPLLIYMMYDTQPIHKEKEWISKPFEAEIKILPPPLDKIGKCIIARGAYNSKTPLLCFLNIVKILKIKDMLPISLLLLFDGEEESGSPSLLKYLEEHEDTFKDCIDAYYPSTKQDIDGKAVLKLGYKGIISFTIKVTSENKEPHSAYSAMIPNPAADLVSLLNTIYSNNEFHINSLKKPYEFTGKENMLINDLLSEINLEKIQKKAGIVQTVEGDPKVIFANYLFKPTFNISTLKSGYLEDGIKNMVPNQAICKIDVRFAHDVSIDEIYNEIREKVNEFAKYSMSRIELSNNFGYESSRVNKDSILIRSLIKSFQDSPIEIWPLSAAAAPLSKINRQLGLNFITGGLGMGGFAHSVNEFIQYDSIINTRLSNYHFLKIYSKLYGDNL